MNLRLYPFTKKTVIAAAVITLLVLFFFVKVEIRGDYEGIFLLNGISPYSLTLTNDVYHGEQDKLLLSFNFNSSNSFFSIPHSYAHNDTSLTYDWHEKTGRGYVTSNYPNGTKLVTCFGRFVEGSGIAPSGLFVGGNLPFPVKVGARTAPNATGMSFYDGARWNHIWCSVNEAFLTNEPQPMNIPPSRMKFLGSMVLKATDKELVITSRHEVNLRNATLLMERYAFFKAGDIHFTLVNRVSNIGRTDANYSYVYGDEPWVGNYGSSRGDVGWMKDQIVNVEGAFDTSNYTYAGIFDYGNPLIDENHNFTRMANFIEWLGDRPNVAFLSNNPGYFEEKQEPLSSDTRFIGLQWGPQTLTPGATKTYILAIGMAGRDAMSGFPVKPRVEFPWENYRAFVR